MERKRGKTRGIMSTAAAGGVLLGLAAVLQLLARRTGWFGTWYAQNVYRWIAGVEARIFEPFPFSAGELLLYALLVFCLLYGICHLRQWKKLLAGAFFVASLLFFIYTANCGINYYRLPFSAYLDYGAGRYSPEELEQLLEWLTQKVNGSYVETGAVEAGVLQQEAVRAMERMGEAYPQLAGYYPRPKPVLFSRILSMQQLCGIYSPFTVEANYNTEMTAYNIPHTMCHELSHLRGFMREDEANFIGVLACMGADDPECRYSGYLMGWLYAGNALASVDLRTYRGYWEELDPRVQEDLYANTAFWDRFDTKISKAAETINNTYLKANSQADGVRSYGRAVDLMLAWYLAGGAASFSVQNCPD